MFQAGLSDAFVWCSQQHPQLEAPPAASLGTGLGPAEELNDVRLNPSGSASGSASVSVIVNMPASYAGSELEPCGSSASPETSGGGTTATGGGGGGSGAVRISSL